MKIKYTINEIETNIAKLTVSFEDACDAYRDALKKRDSNRAIKERIGENSRGTSIHKFQTSFAWILHDLRCGPRCFAEDNINEAEDLIEHIQKIALK